MSNEIRIEALHKRYRDGTVALGSIDLLCPRSRTTALVGPSGSGKTTILKIVAGLLEATSGRVLFEGRDVTRLASEKRNLGMVFQSYALFPNMTVRENVEFGMLVRHVAAAERARRAMAALETVQIPQLADRRIHQLSGGQQQRVALARAVVFQPDILLLDEPLSALDAKIRVELRAELAGLLERFGITAVYVTHDQQEAMSLGDQVVVMDHGKVMQVGTPWEIYAYPANEFTARFVGIANLFDATLRPAGDGFELVTGFASLPLTGDQVHRRWPDLAPGPVRMMCRPENVEVVADGDGHARVHARDRMFLGDRLRVTAEARDGTPVIIEAANHLRIAPGDVLGVRMDLERIHLLPARDGAA